MHPKVRSVRTQPFGELRDQIRDQRRSAKHTSTRTHTMLALPSKTQRPLTESALLTGITTCKWKNRDLLFRRNFSGWIEQLGTDLAC